jgi:hypothetical protein
LTRHSRSDIFITHLDSHSQTHSKNHTQPNTYASLHKLAFTPTVPPTNLSRCACKSKHSTPSAPTSRATMSYAPPAGHQAMCAHHTARGTCKNSAFSAVGNGTRSGKGCQFFSLTQRWRNDECASGLILKRSNKARHYSPTHSPTSFGCSWSSQESIWIEERRRKGPGGFYIVYKKGRREK